MNEIVVINNGQAVTTTLVIAEGTGYDHASVIKLVRKYVGDLQEFGRVGFEIQTFETAGGQQQREYADLNQEQSALLMTYLRNNDVVREFKKALIREFSRMSKLLAERSAQVPVVKDPRTAALIENLIRLDAVEQEQSRQAEALARIQEDVAVIEARTQPENKHFTVAGFAKLVGHSVDIKAASKLGRRCATLSKEQGLPIGDIKDPRFGYVHTYHESVLQAVFDCQV